MSVYKKLLTVRNELRQRELKKTGENKYSNFKYYQLGDFLPSITELCEKIGLFTYVDFDSDSDAKLVIMDVDKREINVTFSCPMAEARVKGASDIQNLGASQTYIRRYLYMNAFEVVDNDVVDETSNPKDPQPQGKKFARSEKQIKRMQRLCIESGRDWKKQSAPLKKKYNVQSLQQLTTEEYNEICDAYENNPVKKEKFDPDKTEEGATENERVDTPKQ